MTMQFIITTLMVAWALGVVVGWKIKFLVRLFQVST